MKDDPHSATSLGIDKTNPNYAGCSAPLFDYPRSAGHKEPTTSQDAAETIEKNGRADSLRRGVLIVLETRGQFGMSADEIAAVMGESVLSIRPRVSELNKRGLIIETKGRARNLSGMTAKVWIKNGK